MYYVDDEDIRYLYLKNILEEKGIKVAIYKAQKNISSNSTLVFSPAKKFDEALAKSLPSNIIMYAGNIKEDIIKILKEKNITYKNLMLDETFTIKNANLTCEGALALMIQHSPKSMYTNNVLILGGGRIAIGLAVLFNKLNINFAMVSYNKTKFPSYKLYTDNTFFAESFVNSLDKYDVIINTIPAEIINDNIVNKIAKDTVFIELASVKCLKEENAKHIKYILAPSLPKIFSPQSAGKLVFDNITGENKYD